MSEFVNEYTITKKLLISWALKPVERLVIWRWVMAIMLIGVVVSECLFFSRVWQFESHKLENFLVFSGIFFIGISLYFLVVRPVMLFHRQYIDLVDYRGSNEWQRTVRIGDEVTLIDGNESVTLPWDKFSGVVALSDCIALAITNGASIRLYPGCYTQGNEKKFLAYINNNHPQLLKK